MKKVIIGRKGVGKTTLIVTEILPALHGVQDYVIIDFNDEYRFLDNPSVQLFSFGDKVKFIDRNAKHLKEQVIDIIRCTNKETVLIIDSADILRYNTIDHLDDFLWLKELLLHKKCILVFQNTATVRESSLVHFFDEMYYFPSLYDDEFKGRYFKTKKKQDTTIHEMTPYSRFKDAE
jgi:archaellum biogenesis ATPase FlaH